MSETVFASSARLLVCLHTAAAIVLIGSSTHHAIIAIGAVRGRYRPRLGTIYATTVAASYGATMLLGAMAYPTYRYHVRALYLDRCAAWASKLFDIKENVALVGLAPALAAVALSRALDTRDRTSTTGYACFVLSVTLVVWIDFFSGLVITMTKGV